MLSLKNKGILREKAKRSFNECNAECDCVASPKIVLFRCTTFKSDTAVDTIVSTAVSLLFESDVVSLIGHAKLVDVFLQFFYKQTDMVTITNCVMHLNCKRKQLFAIPLP